MCFWMDNIKSETLLYFAARTSMILYVCSSRDFEPCFSMHSGISTSTWACYIISGSSSYNLVTEFNTCRWSICVLVLDSLYNLNILKWTSRNSIRKWSDARLRVLSLRISSSIIIWNWSTSSVMLLMFYSMCSKWLLIDCSSSSLSRISFRPRAA